jgi:hypothetical protein
MIKSKNIRKKASSWLGDEFDEPTRNEVRHMLENDEKGLLMPFTRTWNSVRGTPRYNGKPAPPDEPLYPWNGHTGTLKLPEKACADPLPSKWQ